MMRCSPLALVLVVGCGGMDLYDDDEFVPADNSAGDFDSHLEPELLNEHGTTTVEAISSVGNVYRFEFAEGFSRAAPKVMDVLIEDLIDDIAIEVLSDEPPMNDVLLGSLELHAQTATQDPCVPTELPMEATFDENTGEFVVDFDARDLTLGQPFDLMRLSVQGVWNDLTMAVTSPRLIIEADAYSLGEELYSASAHLACDYFEKDDIICEPCDHANSNMCVVFAIDGFRAHNVPDFAIEPISVEDVNAACLSSR